MLGPGCQDLSGEVARGSGRGELFACTPAILILAKILVPVHPGPVWPFGRWVEVMLAFLGSADCSQNPLAPLKGLSSPWDSFQRLVFRPRIPFAAATSSQFQLGVFDFLFVYEIVTIIDYFLEGTSRKVPETREIK